MLETDFFSQYPMTAVIDFNLKGSDTAVVKVHLSLISDDEDGALWDTAVAVLKLVARQLSEEAGFFG